jgi:quercetin dioxygenase-like cupin family protein
VWNVVGVFVLAFAALGTRSVALAEFGLDSLIKIGCIDRRLVGTGGRQTGTVARRVACDRARIGGTVKVAGRRQASPTTIWKQPSLRVRIHEGQEESFYVSDGLVTVQVGDEVIKLQPGDFATAPPGVPHTFTNADPDRTARMVNIMTPGIGFDRYIAAAMSGSDEAEMKRLGKEFGVTMVGPPLPTRLGLG